jgi:formate dehydrogenase gamma subunit
MIRDCKGFLKGSRSVLMAALVGLTLVSGAFAAPAGKPAKAAQLKNEDCLACHADASMTKEVDGKTVSLQVKEDKFKNSVHGQMFQCTDCHKDITALPHDKVAKVDCAQCHTDEQKQYDNSLHAKAIAGGDARAARCLDCHGNIHEVVPSSDAASPVAHKNVPKTCGSCHGQKFVMQQAGMTTAPVMAYQESVHGKLVAGGDTKAAVCSDCHSPHNIKRANDPESSIAKANVALTCAKCHDKEKAAFVTSIHGQALAKGNLHAATCTDCHGIHGIRRPSDPNSPVFAKNLATETCAQCHQNAKMSREFGVVGDRASSYLANYHGMAKEMGSTKVASCANCHTAHNILPASDPKSSVNEANLVKTCGECHSGATQKFAQSRIHADQPLAAGFGDKAVTLVKQAYFGIIFGTIGFMLLHNLIVLRRKLADRRNGHVHASHGPRVVERMTKLQRIQHVLLFTTFFTLVLTGFALKYPNSLLATVFVNEFLRGWLHRIAGVMMIITGLYHVWYLGFVAEGRKMFFDMLPELKDATDTVDVLKYYLGFSDKKPQFKRFNYAEKMEYWALVWGTIVMAVTGLVIWFKVVVGVMVPGWVVDVAVAIHFYEAILATLAIIVWHFYMVIFDPDTYPINWAFLDGKMSMEHYREEHGLDSETIKKYSVSATETEKKHETVGTH